MVEYVIEDLSTYLMKALLTLVGIILVATISLGLHALSVSRSAPRVTVRNDASVPVGDVHVWTNAGTTEIASRLDPGAVATEYVVVNGESGLRVTYSTKGGTVESDCAAYVESQGGYFVEIVIAPDFAVQCDEGLRDLLTGRPRQAR